MLCPTDAYQLVHAHPYLSGSSPNASFLPGLPTVKSYYADQLPEAQWPQTSPPFIVWVPTRDSFDAQRPQQVKTVLRGQLVAVEAPERLKAITFTCGRRPRKPSAEGSQPAPRRPRV